jgi:Type II CAAX prenyl endopeptidase Rce1-like
MDPMRAVVSNPEVRSPLQALGRGSPLATSVEILALYAGILLYIWHWQYTHPYAWIALLVLVVLSHFLHHDHLREMGLTAHEFRPCARVMFPLLAGITVVAVIFALGRNGWVMVFPSAHAWLSLCGYTLWCSFQQYLTQSYFHRRLRTFMTTPHLSSLVIAIMFAGAHIPNPVLMVATFVGGFVFAEVFVRHPNIWPLAIVQAVAGSGYYFYHLH